MSLFENFVAGELPKRSALLTTADTEYDDDPNDIDAPSILQNAPIGTWYLRDTPDTMYRKRDSGWVSTDTASLAGLDDGNAGNPGLAFAAAPTTGIFRDTSGRVALTANGVAAFQAGRTAFSNLQGDPLAADVEWTHPPFNYANENAAVYIKLTHRDDQLNDFIYGIYAEIENQSLTGGSFSKIMHFGRGDAHYVAMFADPAINDGLSGGFAYEGAMFANAECGFLGSFQGTSGFENSNPVQNYCIAFQALVHDDATDPTLQGMNQHTYGLFIAINSLGNSFVVRQSEYIPNPGVPQIKIADHNFRPLWEAFGTGGQIMHGPEADGGSPNTAAPELRQRNYYWDGSDEQVYDVVYSTNVSGAPAAVPQWQLAFQEIVDGVPAAAEAVITIAPTQVNLNDILLTGVGGLAMTAGQQLDLNGGAIADCGSITMAAGGANLDLQGGAINACGTITMIAGGANMDLQGGQLINTGAVSGPSGLVAFGHYRTIANAHTPPGTTQTINWATGNTHYIDLGSATGTVVLTLTNPAQGGNYLIKAHNNVSGVNIDWPLSVFWPAGSPPTISADAVSQDVIVLHFDGVNYFARIYQGFQSNE